jgi:hypothetical protein
LTGAVTVYGKHQKFPSPPDKITPTHNQKEKNIMEQV